MSKFIKFQIEDIGLSVNLDCVAYFKSTKDDGFEIHYRDGQIINFKTGFKTYVKS